MNKNIFDQTLGTPVPNWQSAKRPSTSILQGSYCKLEPFSFSKHTHLLFDALCTHNEDASWTYLPYGPFASFKDFEDWLRSNACGSDPFFYAIIDSQTNTRVGLISYMRINPDHGVIEIAHVHFSDSLKKSRAGTEAVYLMLKEAFDKLGYRRCEWKCNSLNAKSKASALRFGFSYEGCFRQDRIFKGYNRHTDWFSIIDREWSSIRTRLDGWLNPLNFDEDGRQKKSLERTAMR